MTPDDRKWLTALHNQVNALHDQLNAVQVQGNTNTEAVQKLAATGEHLVMAVAEARFALIAAGTALGEIAHQTGRGQEELDELLSSILGAGEAAFSRIPAGPAKAGLKATDTIRKYAELHLQRRLKQS